MGGAPAGHPILEWMNGRMNGEDLQPSQTPGADHWTSGRSCPRAAVHTLQQDVREHPEAAVYWVRWQRREWSVELESSARTPGTQQQRPADCSRGRQPAGKEWSNCPCFPGILPVAWYLLGGVLWDASKHVVAVHKEGGSNSVTDAQCLQRKRKKRSCPPRSMGHPAPPCPHRLAAALRRFRVDNSSALPGGAEAAKGGIGRLSRCSTTRFLTFPR